MSEKTEKQKRREGKANQPIQPTEQEIYAFNVLNGTCANAQAELNRTIEARQAYIELMETKYQATFDAATGAFLPSKEEEPEKDADN